MLAFRIGSMPVLTTIASRDSVGLLTLVALIGALSAGAPDLAIVALFPAVVLFWPKTSAPPPRYSPIR